MPVGRDQEGRKHYAVVGIGPDVTSIPDRAPANEGPVKKDPLEWRLSSCSEDPEELKAKSRVSI